MSRLSLTCLIVLLLLTCGCRQVTVPVAIPVPIAHIKYPDVEADFLAKNNVLSTVDSIPGNKFSINYGSYNKMGRIVEQYPKFSFCGNDFQTNRYNKQGFKIGVDAMLDEESIFYNDADNRVLYQARYNVSHDPNYGLYVKPMGIRSYIYNDTGRISNEYYKNITPDGITFDNSSYHYDSEGKIVSIKRTDTYVSKYSCPRIEKKDPRTGYYFKYYYYSKNILDSIVSKSSCGICAKMKMVAYCNAKGLVQYTDHMYDDTIHRFYRSYTFRK